MTPRICYVAQGFPNPRGLRWKQLLSEEGIACTVVFGRSQFAQLGETGADAIQVKRLGPPTTAAFCSLLGSVRSRLNTSDIHAVWARDVLAGMPAYRLARALHVPFVLDICDAYPEVMRLLADRKRWWLPVAATVADRFESYLVRRADLVLTTCPESIAHLVAKHRLPGSTVSRMVSIENVPLSEDLSRPRRVRDAHGGPIVMCYVGSYDRSVRDLRTVVEGAERFRAATGRDWRLRIATFDRTEVEADVGASGADIRSRIEFVEPMPHAQVGAFLDEADIGLVPHGSGPVLETTTSNKLFEYLAAGLPVLASGNEPNVRVLADAGGGLTYLPHDTADFARALGRLCSDEWSLRADSSWVAKYSWRAQSRELRSRLEQLGVRKNVDTTR